MYKYTYTEYQQCPPSCGGNWECGTETTVCLSKSPKKATSMRGTVVRRFVGRDGVPILSFRRFERDGKLIWERWD